MKLTALLAAAAVAAATTSSFAAAAGVDADNGRDLIRGGRPAARTGRKGSLVLGDGDDWDDVDDGAGGPNIARGWGGGGGGGGWGGGTSWDKYDDYACTYGHEGGVEGRDFDKKYGVSFSWCQDKCEDIHGCTAFDYDDHKDRCRIFYTYPHSKKYKHGLKCWRKKKEQEEIHWDKYYDYACTYGDEGGVEGYDFDKKYGVNFSWCQDKCEDIHKCTAFDYDYDKDRCRIFYTYPHSKKYKDDLTCWKKEQDWW